MVESGRIELHPSWDEPFCIVLRIVLRLTSAASLMPRSLPILVRATGVEPVIPKASDFKSDAYANSATPAYWRLGVYHDTAETERIMSHEVEGLFPSQPYILSIAQIFEFVNTFLKKIFNFLQCGSSTEEPS